MGAAFGTLSCGWACPVGFIQDILRAPKIKEIKISNRLSVFRYLVFLVSIALLLVELNLNFFSKRGITIFHEYVIITGGILLTAAIFIKRPFCRILCPLGFILGKLNKISFLRVILNKGRCSGCQECNKVCLMDLQPLSDVNSDLCVKCFNCAQVCKQQKQNS
jgi:polyferredoxin